MKIVLLTTDTPHHSFFAHKIACCHGFQSIFVETRCVTAPFETRHPFEGRRDDYERAVLVSEHGGGLGDLANCVSIGSVNEPDAVTALGRLLPEIVVIFGTGKVKPEVIRCASVACMNLHGGNPEEYRGLDCHLWSIYHKDFANLITTLHFADAGLDTGDIIHQSPIPLYKDMPLHELRLANTRVCVDLVHQALREIEAVGRLAARKQRSRGRYYSFMPAVLKEDCLAKFKAHTSSL